MIVYHNPKTGYTYIVPNHYNHSLKYIKETLNWAKTKGLTVPDDNFITFEVLRGDVHSGMLSIEFESKTKPNCEFIDLQKFPHMSKNLVY